MEAREFNRLLKSIGKEAKAMDSLFSYYFKRIVFHLHIKYGRAVAEDAAQSFFKSLLEIATKQPYIKYPTSWVYTCSENIAKRMIEKESRIIIPEVSNDPFELIKADLYDDLYRELKKLDILDRDIIFKHDWEGYNFEEIAIIHQCKSGTIRQRYNRAIKKLNKVL